MPFNCQLPLMTLTSEMNASYASNVQRPSTAMAESCFPGFNYDGFPMDPSMSASATVVSNATNNVQPLTCPPAFVVAAPRPLSSASSLAAPNPTFSDERSNGFLTRVMPKGSSAAKLNDDTLPTHPVPEFLCHIMSMVQDPVLCDIIAWVVPTENEPEDNGGGIQGVGKIVVYNPQRFQDFVLGNYYRHSKFSSFQRQMNYFGFKKRIHSGKKRKMSPCSFVNEKLGKDPQSLLLLKRKVRASKTHFRDVDDLTQGQDKYPQAGHVTQHPDRTAVIGKHLCADVMGGHNMSHESLTACNGHPMNPSFMTEAFFNHSFSSPIQSHPKISSVITCPQPFIKMISNPVLNQNEASFSRVTVAAREAKQSLFQAYQKNKLELLQKEVYSESAAGARGPVHLGNACGHYGAYDSKTWIVTPPDQSMHVSVVAHTNDVMTSLPKSPMLWSPALAASPSIPLPKRAASKPRQSVRGAEAPIDLDEYSRLLSTLLPPSNELFDDGSLTSSLWDEEEFQDADDCSILSMELGLTG